MAATGPGGQWRTMQARPARTVGTHDRYLGWVLNMCNDLAVVLRGVDLVPDGAVVKFGIHVEEREPLSRAGTEVDCCQVPILVQDKDLDDRRKRGPQKDRMRVYVDYDQEALTLLP